MDSQPVKICVITTVSSTIRAFLMNQLEYLAQNGFDVTVVCDNDPDFAKDCPAHLNFTPIHMTRGIGLWSTLAGCWKLMLLSKKQRFDIIQYSTPKAALISSLAGFIAGTPIRLYCQWGIRYVGFSGYKRKLFKLLEKITCLLSTDIAPDSCGNLEFAINEGLYPRSKGSVIHNGSANGVNLEKFNINCKQLWRNNIRSGLGLDKSSFVYGYIGRITRDKGINELVNAFSRLAISDSNIFLLLVGPEEENNGLNYRVLDTIHNHPQIIMVGSKNNPEEYIAAMDVVVLPSYREGFGIVAIEAQAMGVPVITTDIPGPREALINGETGILIPSANEHDLLAAMLKLKNDLVLLKYMGDRGYDYVKENFEQKIFWQKVLEHRRALLS